MSAHIEDLSDRELSESWVALRSDHVPRPTWQELHAHALARRARRTGGSHLELVGRAPKPSSVLAPSRFILIDGELCEQVSP